LNSGFNGGAKEFVPLAVGGGRPRDAINAAKRGGALFPVRQPCRTLRF
jgi:hypothetical protein